MAEEGQPNYGSACSTVSPGPTQALRREREGRRRLENEQECPLQVAGNFHFAPGKSFQQSHVHGE